MTRYRDGEPSTRQLVVEGSPQGPVILQTVSRGSPRCTFRLTWDLGLSYSLNLRPFIITLLFDVYNLLDSRAEIIEDAYTGGYFRRPLEMVPGRSFMGQLRFELQG